MIMASYDEATDLSQAIMWGHASLLACLTSAFGKRHATTWLCDCMLPLASSTSVVALERRKRRTVGVRLFDSELLPGLRVLERPVENLALRRLQPRSSWRE